MKVLQVIASNNQIMIDAARKSCIDHCDDDDSSGLKARQSRVAGNESPFIITKLRCSRQEKFVENIDRLVQSTMWGNMSAPLLSWAFSKLVLSWLQTVQCQAGELFELLNGMLRTRNARNISSCFWRARSAQWYDQKMEGSMRARKHAPDIFRTPYFKSVSTMLKTTTHRYLYYFHFLQTRCTRQQMLAHIVLLVCRRPPLVHFASHTSRHANHRSVSCIVALEYGRARAPVLSLNHIQLAWRSITTMPNVWNGF